MTRFRELSDDQLAETFTAVVSEVHARGMEVIIVFTESGASIKIGTLDEVNPS